MAGRLHKLSDLKIEAALRRAREATKSGDGKAALVGDGGGLTLQITAAATASWLFRYMRAGKAKTVGLGGYPAVSLKAARERAMAFRTQLMEGKDPQQERARHQVAEAANDILASFDHCAAEYIDAHRAEWKNLKHGKQWEATLRTYASPVIGQLPVSAIGTTEVRQILAPIWLTKSETASRLRGRIEAVIDWAIAHGLREGDNPARWKGHLEHLLAKSTPKSRRTVHHAALPYGDMHAFMRKLAEQDGMSRWALEFLILTASRTSEVTNATWDEIDLRDALWIIPAARMKAGKEHRVPLVARALQVLHEVAPFRRGAYVFPGAAKDAALSNMAMSMLLRRMGFGDFTVHGFRSTFRDYVAAETQHDFHTGEAALAHRLQDRVAAAYARTDLLDKRLAMMRDWEAFLATAER